METRLDEAVRLGIMARILYPSLDIDVHKIDWVGDGVETYHGMEMEKRTYKDQILKVIYLEEEKTLAIGTKFRPTSNWANS